MTSEEKLDEALKGTFPASDPFYLPPEHAVPVQVPLNPAARPGAGAAGSERRPW
jgi:hypothetical protein